MATSKAIKELAEKLLPTDYSSRMSRAKEMGMMTGMPLYHGTRGDISEFSLERGGEVSRSPVGKLGVSLATDPQTASEFASLAGDEGANVIQAYHRASKPVRIELDGTETNMEVAATVQDAWDQGFDAIKFDNYTTPGGSTGKSFILVKDPNQVRSVNARFDPSNVESRNILASSIPAGIGIGALSRGQPATAKEIQQLKLAESMLSDQPPLPGDVAKIENIQGNPMMVRLAQILSDYTETPLGPALQGTSDLLMKYGYGQKRTIPDYMKATLDFL